MDVAEFPLVVLLVSVGAYQLAYRLKGDRVQVNEVDLVDVDAASGQMRGAAWLNIFSPRMESFNLGQSRSPRRPLPGQRMDGLVGTARRGAGRHESARRRTNAVDAAVQLFAGPGGPVRRADPGVVDQEFYGPMEAAATKAFPAADLAEDRSDSWPARSPTRWPFRWTSASSPTARSVYDLGTIAPGESARLGTMTKAQRVEDAC